MTNQINTPEMAVLLKQAKEGLATQQGGQVVVQQIHIHQGNESEPQGLLHASFRGTVRWVLRPIGQVAKWGTAPIWWPLGMLARDVAATPRRIGKALADPWKQDWEALREDHEEWQVATPEERNSMVAQARGWFGLSLVFVLSTLIVPGQAKWIPLLGFLGLVGVRKGWCPVRSYLCMPQGGWGALADHIGETASVVFWGGVLTHKAKLAKRALDAIPEPKTEVPPVEEPNTAMPVPQAQIQGEEPVWSGSVQ